MIRALILFYLNIKSTHGYEIQRFIQLSGINQWTKIQSGSIYYALAKLEKEGNISVVCEEQVGSRIRKVYKITEQGKATLKAEMCRELSEPIVEVGSFKFITEPMLSALEEEEMVPLLKKHIEELEETKKYWEKWKNIKGSDKASRLTSLSFDMTIHSIEDQILWHTELLNNLHSYKEQGQAMVEVIRSFESEHMEEAEDLELNRKIQFVENIKRTLKQYPEAAEKSLDQLIEEMKKMK